MTTHLALLRGINVSGHNMIKMQDLQKTLENEGFTNIKTYIQSGNVYLDAPEENPASIGFQMTQLLFRTHGIEVPVLVISKKTLQECLSNNPFLKEKEVDTKKLYVAFLSKEITKEAINDLKTSQFKPDEVAIDGSKIYIKYAIGAGKTKLDQKYIEKKLNLVATIRNWNTVTNLLEL